MFDSHISMDAQISSVCRATHFHLRNIRAIRHLLTDDAAASLVHALVTSRIDYCNSLLFGLPDCKLNRLQRIHNIAARIVSRCSKSDHITPVLHSLHWLPVQQRITYKLMLLTFKCIHGLAPSYLAELVSLHQQPRALRSGSQHLLHVPRSRLKTYGDRCFEVAAPTEWNKLPMALRETKSLPMFKSMLKTHLFTLFVSNKLS